VESLTATAEDLSADLSAAAAASPLSGENGETGAETYRVTIEGVTYEQYRQILNICPLAEAEKE
jgi:hypothetical protein